MKELIEKFVGHEVVIRLSGFKVLATVLDVKKVYGKTRYLVTPVAGSGSCWVETVYLPED